MHMADLPLLIRWLAAPHVRAWWEEPPSDEVLVAKYAPRIEGHSLTFMYVVTVDDRAVGMMQCYRIRDYPGWAATLRATGAVDPAAATGIDYLIGDESVTRRGIGSKALREFAGVVFDRYDDTEIVVAAPQQANRGSWRALENAGFTRIWEGRLDSDDPSDAGPAYIYVRPL
jgi:RimJ/RimL family protein N-acetyltransferase